VGRPPQHRTDGTEQQQVRYALDLGLLQPQRRGAAAGQGGHVLRTPQDESFNFSLRKVFH
jgi:hypothetical protein